MPRTDTITIPAGANASQVEFTYEQRDPATGVWSPVVGALVQLHLSTAADGVAVPGSPLTLAESATPGTYRGVKPASMALVANTAYRFRIVGSASGAEYEDRGDVIVRD